MNRNENTEAKYSFTDPGISFLPLTVFIIIAILFFVLSVASSLSVKYKQTSIYSSITGYIIYFVIAFLVGWLIYYLCKKNQTTWAWVIVLLWVLIPVVIFLMAGAFVAGLSIGMTTKNTNDNYP